MPISIEMEDRLPVVNPGECHVPAVLLVDTSGSMTGEPINELNQGLREFYDALSQDDLAMGRAEVTIISFNSSVNVEMGFRPAEQYEAPILSAGGLTALNQALMMGLDEIAARKKVYKENGIKYYRPWLFVLTDGYPTDTSLEGEAVRRMREAIEGKKITYMPMGIGSADLEQLKKYYPENYPSKITLSANAQEFRSAFQWLSASLTEITHSDPKITSTVKMPPTPPDIVVGI